MFAKVTRKFRDRHTNELRPLGSVFECSEERFAEIEAAGKRAGKCYAMRVEMEAGATEAATSAADAANSAIDIAVDSAKVAQSAAHAFTALEKPLEAMSAKELREYADKAHKLTFGAKTGKAEMIEAIRRAEA